MGQERDLDHHMVVYHGDMDIRGPFECPIVHCFRRDEHPFPSEHHLTRHIKTVHGVNRSDQKPIDLELGLG